MAHRAKRLATVFVGLAAITLGGCGEGNDPAKPVTLSPARTELYASSCKTCHEAPATGAPQSHDTIAWTPRLEKGADVLLDSIVNGFNGMPPLGQCIECDAEDFLALTRFMAAPSATNANDEPEGETP
ncbi:MAG: c-type cytochrome [Parvibaculum sp.]|uniref:c-type cytochrome n=1 Tax=Parvibaculum sp. TaxID=2024848 RepID=UPI002AB87A77|nr:c-type cytochrome [Parvibaculum sp.]MDZ4380714.1 c-type cytochrome [Parvibaculum sp.]